MKLYFQNINKITLSLDNFLNLGKRQKTIAVIIFFITAVFVFKYLKIDQHVGKRPCSVHVWAQCMRASIAENYYEESMNFFQPRLHNVLGGEGVTGMEFPFVNYSVAVLYKLFGFNEAYFRGFVAFSMFLGLVFFFFLSFSLLKNALISVIVVGLCYFSPVLIYYTANFMPDTTSLGLVLIGWCLFFIYTKTNSVKYVYLLFTFLTLAALIKITSLIAVGVICCLLFLDYLNFFHKTNQGEKLIKHIKVFIACIVLSIILVASWYIYANWLSKAYNSNAFTLGSEYVTDKSEFLKIWELIKQNWVPEYFNPEFYTILLFMFCIMMVFAKHVSRLLFTVTIFNFLGSCSFVFLMFRQFRDHDYYIIPLLPFIFFLILTFFDFVIKVSDKFFRPIKYIVAVYFTIILCNNAVYSRNHYVDRHSENYLLYTGDFRRYYDLEPKLRELGIKKHDMTFTGLDVSFSNSLYLMNQVGYQFNEYRKDYFDFVFSLKPRVLVLNDTAAFNKAYPNNFKDRIVGEHKGLIIYKLY